MKKGQRLSCFSSDFSAGVSLRIIDSYPVDLIALYLQVIDVFLCVQVDAHGFLLNSHDRETHVDAAVQLPFLDLRDTCTAASIIWAAENAGSCCCVNTKANWCRGQDKNHMFHLIPSGVLILFCSFILSDTAALCCRLPTRRLRVQFQAWTLFCWPCLYL